MQKQSTFYAVISIFFFWGFMAASNGIFIPFCKEYFRLSQFQSQLIDFTFYGGYFIGSLLLFLYAALNRRDFVNQYGYARSFSIGLVISAVGALCMIPSLHIGNYGFILTSFFIIALGFCLQQTAANPFVILLGEERTGAHRLSLAGGVNSLGTTIGPVIVAYFLFGTVSASGSMSTVQLKNIDTLYGILIALFLTLAFVLNRMKMEEQPAHEASSGFSFAALKYPQLVLGMAGIFIYVGVEVTIQSNMGALLDTPEYGNIKSNLIFPFISLYWGSLMMGRWAGASESLSANPSVRRILQLMLPFAAFGVVYLVNYLKAYDMPEVDLNSLFLPYLGFVLLLVLITYLSVESSAKMLLAFSLAALLCMVGGLLTKGNLSLMFFLSGGLWCSVMWPCIFALAIKNLGPYTSQGSSFLIMMILGGAIIPPIQGWLADVTTIKASYIITPLCFAYLAWYGWWGLRNNQGVEEKVLH
jgi:FHS family L-fucose permease-like MFS transporter